MANVEGDVANDNDDHSDDQPVPLVDCVTEVLVSDDDGIDGRLSNYKRKHKRSQFPWKHTREWALGDASNVKGRRQCIQCRKWFSISFNTSGWKIHLSKKRGIVSPRSGIAYSENSLSGSGTHLAQRCISAAILPDRLLVKFENAVVDFVISDGLSLRTAGGDQFKLLVKTLTQGYDPPSTRTIVRRIVEVFAIMQHVVAAFFANLDVAFSLNIDGWSNRNLKGFWMVTAHWIDTSSGESRSVLLTILDVVCGRGIGKRVGGFPLGFSPLPS
jgi:hypothetical protein